jgi:hypothetical protein
MTEHNRMLKEIRTYLCIQKVKAEYNKTVQRTPIKRRIKWLSVGGRAARVARQWLT